MFILRRECPYFVKIKAMTKKRKKKLNPVSTRTICTTVLVEIVMKSFESHLFILCYVAFISSLKRVYGMSFEQT